MAYMVNFEDQEKKKESEQNALASGETPYQVSSSQGGSEAVGSSGSSGNNSKQNTTQNQSGTWVNLNKYLDTNAGKATQYADTLVKPYTDTQEQFKSDLNTSKDNYTNDVKSDVAYNTDSNWTQAYSKQAAKDNTVSEPSISNGEKILNDPALDQNLDNNKRYSQTQYGYDRADEYQNTGDTFGYNALNDQSNVYTDVAGKLGTEEGRIGLVDELTRNQNRRVTAGGSALNNLVLQGSSEAQNKLQDHAIKFKELTDLLNTQTSDLNTMRQGVVDQATINQNAATQNRLDAEAAEKERIKKERDDFLKAQADNKTNLAKGQVAAGSNLKGLTSAQVAEALKISSNDLTKFLNQDTNAKTIYDQALSNVENRIKQLDSGTYEGIGAYSKPNQDVFNQTAFDKVIGAEQTRRNEHVNALLKTLPKSSTFEKNSYNNAFNNPTSSWSKLVDDYKNYKISDADFDKRLKGYSAGMPNSTLYTSNESPVLDTVWDYAVEKPIETVKKIGSWVGDRFDW